jgi:glycosyltransferase involved in cell wall biosynthesis
MKQPVPGERNLIANSDRAEVSPEEVTFVVIAYNEAFGIEQCLRSIAAQEGLFNYEIVVVDDGSNDATPSVLAQLGEEIPKLRVVRQPANLGRGAARATGVRTARGEFIAMVDADIVLPPDWLLRCLAGIAGRDVVSGTAVPGGDVGYLARRFGLEPKVVPSTTPTTGNNALFRRVVFSRVAYEEDLREGEDVALDHQMDAAGVVRGVIPGLRVEHRENKTFSRELRWLFESGLGASRELERYRRVRGPDVAFGVMLLSCAASCFASRRRTGRLLAPFVCLAVIAIAHVATRFQSRGAPLRYLGAVMADSALLGFYFAGRLVGHVWLRFDAGAK